MMKNPQIGTRATPITKNKNIWKSFLELKMNGPIGYSSLLIFSDIILLELFKNYIIKY